jgi:hypothetical protein
LNISFLVFQKFVYDGGDLLYANFRERNLWPMEKRFQPAARRLRLFRHAPGEAEYHGAVFASVDAATGPNVDVACSFATIRELFAKGTDELRRTSGATTGATISSRLDAYK